MLIARLPEAAWPAADPYQCLAHWLVGRSPAQPVGMESEWMQLVTLAEAEGVGPLLHRALRALPSIEVPATPRKILATAYRRAVYARLLQEATRAHLCRCLGERGIPVFLTKGAALAFHYYEDPATRPMRDLDVLVPRSRLAEAARCLEAGNFLPRREPRCLIPAMNGPRVHLVYEHAVTRVLVELHWTPRGLGRAQALALAEIWSDPGTVADDDVARPMRPGHMIPLLCAHMLLRHQCARLLWLFDLHRVLLATEAREARLACDMATRWRLGPCTALALLRMRELFGTPLPRELATWAKETASRDNRQARLATLVLTRSEAERPPIALVNLVMQGDWELLCSLFPDPATLRDRMGLGPHENIFPAYAALFGGYLRNGPTYCRQLWRTVLRPWPLSTALGAPRTRSSAREEP
jgi:hypothetical protein